MNIWTQEQTERYFLAEDLKGWIDDEMWPQDVGGAPIVSDLYGWALSHVDWDEIAVACLETARGDRSSVTDERDSIS